MESKYRELKAIWLNGARDRETGLRLMFLSWMHWADPPFVTGLEEDYNAKRLWLDVFDWFGGETTTDTEFLYVAGIMASLFPYVLGDESVWGERGARMKKRATEAQASTHTRIAFNDLDEYGKYFAHQLRREFSQ